MNPKNRFFLLALLLLLIAAVAACSDDEGKDGKGGGKGKGGGGGEVVGVCPAVVSLALPEQLTPEEFARTRYEQCKRDIECNLSGSSFSTMEDCEKEKKRSLEESFPTQEHVDELKNSCLGRAFYCAYYQIASLSCDYHNDTTTDPASPDYMQRVLNSAQCHLDCMGDMKCEDSATEAEKFKYDFPVNASEKQGLTETQVTDLMHKVCEKAATCGIEDIVPAKDDTKSCKQAMDELIADTPEGFGDCLPNKNYMAFCFHHCAAAYDCSVMKRHYNPKEYYRPTLKQSAQFQACLESCTKVANCN